MKAYWDKFVAYIKAMPFWLQLAISFGVGVILGIIVL